ncbi:MAG: hypothetical protein R3B67_11410 [Phycisphaerales bacterium]
MRRHRRRVPVHHRLADIFATSVLSYDAGSNATAGYTDANTAAQVSRAFHRRGYLPGGVTPSTRRGRPMNSSRSARAEHLSLGFNTAITNDASHLYGIDLIVFSNSGFVDTSWSDADPNNDGSGVVGSNPFIFGAGGEATIQVSQNGTDWFTASITTLDLFPTLGYSDYTTTTPAGPGTVESDFTRAIDPTTALADLANMSFAELVAFYDGSGGGIGIDIASSGLDSASYVRFLNNSGEAFEIDAVAVVPAPGVLFMLGLGGIFATPRRRARHLS